MSFTLRNEHAFQTVEVGGLGLPLAFQACPLLPALVLQCPHSGTFSP